MPSANDAHRPRISLKIRLMGVVGVVASEASLVTTTRDACARRRGRRVGGPRGGGNGIGATDGAETPTNTSDSLCGSCAKGVFPLRVAPATLDM
jgi:hypothetical protein